MEKQFTIENHTETPGNYRNQILKIINDVEISVRAINPDKIMHTETHGQRLMDIRNESIEIKPVREDICKTFGVPDDEDHIYIEEESESYLSGEKIQRVVRAFYVLVDLLEKEAFYAEGRAGHNDLLKSMLKMGSSVDENLSNFNDVIDGLSEEPPRFMYAKGFMSTDGFKDELVASRRFLETPIYDQDGNLVETPKNWFVTGENVNFAFKKIERKSELQESENPTNQPTE